MGQKVNPIGFRLGIIEEWRSKWFANKKNYPRLLEQDVRVRKYLNKALREALVNRIDIERSRNNVTIIIHAAKPGLIIGRGGAGIEKLKKEVERKFFKGKSILQLKLNK